MRKEFFFFIENLSDLCLRDLWDIRCCVYVETSLINGWHCLFRKSICFVHDVLNSSVRIFVIRRDILSSCNWERSLTRYRKTNSLSSGFSENTHVYTFTHTHTHNPPHPFRPISLVFFIYCKKDDSPYYVNRPFSFLTNNFPCSIR